LFDIASEAIDTSSMASLDPEPTPERLWIVTKGEFFGEIDGRSFGATIHYDSDKNRFEIKSSQLGAATVFTGNNSSTPLLDYLNKTQRFRLLLDSSVTYAKGAFYKPNLLPWRGGGDRINIERIVTGCDALKGTTSEKGDLTGWHSGSVFGTIEDKTKVFTDAAWMPEILVCNDVGSPEIADFFALCTKTKKIVMIHAKNARKGSTMSASAFHDVCSQAIRYLGFFNPADNRAKLTTPQISGSWCPDANKYKSRKRLIWTPPGQTAAKVNKIFRTSLSDPTFGREVWMVIGNGLSQAAFKKAVAKSDPKPNEREMSYLFQSTWSSIASVGASLRVFCMK
jgi:hypothetical protein